MGSPARTTDARTRLGRRLWRSVLAPIGWSALLLGASAEVVEHTGLLRGWATAALARRLGLEAGSIRVADVAVSWTRRAVRLERVELGPGRDDLRLEDAELILAWSPRDGLHVERITVGGGRVRFGHELATWLRERLPAATDGPRAADLRPVVPELALRAIELSIAGEDGRESPAGDVWLSVADGPEGLRLSGRWRPVAGPAEGGVALNGRVTDSGVLELSAGARGWTLDGAWPPFAAGDAPWARWRPRGRLDLDATGRFALSGASPPELDVVLRLREGALVVPVEGATEVELEGVALDARAGLEAGADGAPWSLGAWRVLVEGEATCLGAPLAAGLRVGMWAQRDNLADGWIRVPRLELGGPVAELIERVDALAELDAMLAPRGELGLSLGFAVPEGWRAERDGLAGIGQALVVRAEGKTSVAYVGQQNPAQGGARNHGFPLRAEAVAGHVTYVHRPGAIRPERLGIHAVHGVAGGEPVTASGSLSRRMGQARDARGRPPIRQIFHLAVHGDGVRVDDELGAAFQGLSGVHGCERLWETYAPTGGRLGFDLRFDHRPESEQLATTLAIQLDGVGCRWEPLPVPVEDASGDLLLVVDDAGGGAFTLRAQARTSAARGRVLVNGRAEHAGGEELACFDARVEGLNLRSSDLRAILEERQPTLSRTLEEIGPKGWVDLQVTHVQPEGEPGWNWVEATTCEEGCQFQVRAFPMETRKVQARVALAMEADEERGRLDPRARVLVAGEWADAAQGIPLYGTLTADPGRPSALSVVGAGVDLSNQGLLATLAGALGARDADVSRLQMVGHADFAFDRTFPGGAAAREPSDGVVELYARLESLGIGGVDLLRDLDGPVRYRERDRVWTGDRLRAELGRTPVDVSDLSIRREDDDWVLETGLSARELPIDREHLRYFLDPHALRALLEDFEAGGWFDLEGGRVRLRASAAGETSLGLTGKLSLHDVFVRIGLPIAVRSAERIDLELVYENGRARAWAQVPDFDGAVAGRRLEGARMQLTYVDPRLTIEAFRGQFEGGQLRSLATPGSTSSGFFAVDLEAPFPFSLAAQMDDVDVGKLLRGLFRSDFANEGLVDTELRLVGDLGRLTEIHGDGQFVISDTSLWAIPVFQAVFAQLGFDTTAVFSSMQSRFAIEDGVIDMAEISVKSDLLSLVGSGRLDFDGSLDHELQVRYGLIDRLGPLTRLLYQIQNSLLRISIRGDFSRPEVVVGGLFSQFFRRSSKERRLPLPELSPLPPRF